MNIVLVLVFGSAIRKVGPCYFLYAARGRWRAAGPGVCTVRVNRAQLLFTVPSWVILRAYYWFQRQDVGRQWMSDVL